MFILHENEKKNHFIPQNLNEQRHRRKYVLDNVYEIYSTHFSLGQKYLALLKVKL